MRCLEAGYDAYGRDDGDLHHVLLEGHLLQYARLHLHTKSQVAGIEPVSLQ
jgi:hypothetical protein